MEQPVHTCMTKAVIAEGDQLRCGPRWIAARRAKLRLYSDRLECGNWTVPYDQIRDAVLTSFRSPILRIPGYVLSVRTDEKTYHFGLSGSRYWRGELPFPVNRERGRLRLSAISLLARGVLLGFVVYYAWRWLASVLQ